MRFIRFTKLQAVGNDFILIDSRAQPIDDYSFFAIKACDRHFGIGSDGLIVLEDSDKESIRMLFFNPDGTRDMCGNGMKCVARYLFEQQGRTHTNFTIETDVAVIPVDLLEDEIFQVKMPKPVIKNKEFTLNVRGCHLNAWLIDTGTPHCVVFVPDLKEYNIRELGPEVEHNSIFAELVNFDLVMVYDRRSVKARIWERGVGETLACGTGASAMVIAGCERGLLDSKVSVSMPGGELQVRWNKNTEELFVLGSADIVFEGRMTL